MQKQSKYGNEEVFVVPYHNTSHIENGFTRVDSEKNIWSKFDRLGKYIYRDIVEGKAETQQIIPYIVIRSNEGRYLVAKKKNIAKDEIKNTISLGFGGHIEPCDGDKDILFQAAARNLLEEVSLYPYNTMKFKGYVREMNSDIKDHLGCVFLIDDIDEKETKILKQDVYNQDWFTKNQLIEHYAKLETWSKHIANYLVENNL